MSRSHVRESGTTLIAALRLQAAATADFQVDGENPDRRGPEIVVTVKIFQVQAPHNHQSASKALENQP